MKRQTLFDLIKAHFMGNDIEFTKNAKKIAREVKRLGDVELYKGISEILRKNTFVNLSDNDFEMIMNKYQRELLKVLNYGINRKIVKHIFIYGRPGTGKTLFAKNISMLINKEIKTVHLSEIINSKLGESMKLIEDIFEKNRGKIIFLDEVDSIASKRNSSFDILEINRILNTLLKIMDSPDEETIIICATNLFKNIDPAFLRRFHLIINFDKYSYSENLDIWKLYCNRFGVKKETMFFRNFILLLEKTFDLWTPSFLENLARIVSLWQINETIPLEQLIEIFNQINLTKEKAISRQLPMSVIKYFWNDKMEAA